MPTLVHFPSEPDVESMSGSISAPPPIVGAPTGVTAFLGRAPMGPVGMPVACASLAAACAVFGRCLDDFPLGRSLADFFQNGGATAIVVRLAAAENPGQRARIQLGELLLEAANPGVWGNGICASAYDMDSDGRFILDIAHIDTGRRERLVGVSTQPDAFVDRLDRQLKTLSELLTVPAESDPHPRPLGDPVIGETVRGSGGSDSGPLTAADLIAGLQQLDHVQAFNLLVIPPDEQGQDIASEVWKAAAEYCQGRDAFLLIDPPSNWTSVEAVVAAQTRSPLLPRHLRRSAAVHYPCLVHRTNDGAEIAFPPSGAVAGAYARADRLRGVWTPPTVQRSRIGGFAGLADQIGLIGDQGLAPLGVNSLLVERDGGATIVGDRTLVGLDTRWDADTYVSVRRLILHIEKSLRDGLMWTVFSPNGPALWTAMRQSVNSLMQRLSARGALTYVSVSCGLGETMTADDILSGIVNLVVHCQPAGCRDMVTLTFQQQNAGPGA